MGKVYDVDSLLAHVNNDKDTHKDKENKKKGFMYKALLLCVAIYLGIHQSFAQFTTSIFPFSMRTNASGVTNFPGNKCLFWVAD